MKVDDNLKSNELVTKATDASRYVDKESIKGKILLTNQNRIYFISYDGDKYDIKINPKDIKEVINFKNKKFISNGICVYTKDSNKIEFAINKRREWNIALNKIY